MASAAVPVSHGMETKLSMGAGASAGLPLDVRAHIMAYVPFADALAMRPIAPEMRDAVDIGLCEQFICVTLSCPPPRWPCFFRHVVLHSTVAWTTASIQTLVQTGGGGTITHLDMSRCGKPGLTDGAFVALATSSTLQHLNMSECCQTSITDGAFVALATLTSLQHLCSIWFLAHSK